MPIINRKLTYSEQVEDKKDYLKIQAVERKQFDVCGKKEEAFFIKQNKKLRTFLKVECLTNYNSLLQFEYETYKQELNAIISFCACKLRILTKKINLEDYQLGIDLIEEKNEIATIFKQDMLEEINNLPYILEYYLELEHVDEECLLDNVRYFLNLSANLKFFNISIPKQNEMSYLYDQVILGDVGCVYNPTHIVYNQGQENEYYCKYLYVKEVQSRQAINFLESLCLYGGDVYFDIKPISKSQAKEIANRSIQQLKKSLKSKINQETDITEKQNELAKVFSIMNDIIEDRDNIIEIKIIIKLIDNDLTSLTKRIKDLKAENKNISFIEPMYNYQELELEYLNVKPLSISELTLTQWILTNSFAFSYNTYIQKNGFLISEKNQSIVILNRQIFSQSTGQSSFNEAFFGIMGSGKSTWQKTYILQDLVLNNQIIALDYALEYFNLCKMFNGTIIDIFDNKTFLNPFDIFVVNGSINYKKIGAFLSMLYQQVNQNQAIRTRLENLFVEHADKVSNKTFANYLDYFIKLNKENPNFIEQEILDILININTQYPFFNQPTNVKLDNLFVVFDMSKIKNDEVLRPAIAFLIIFLFNNLMYNNIYKLNINSDEKELNQLINYANRKQINISSVLENNNFNEKTEIEQVQILKKYIETHHPKVRLIIDEAHNLLRDKSIVEDMLNICKEGRKHNAGITISTQTPDVMFRDDNKGLKEMYQLISYKYFLKQDDLSTFTTIEEHGGEPIPKSIINFLLNHAQQGMGFLKLNNIFIPVGKNLSAKLDNLFDGGIGEN